MYSDGLFEFLPTAFVVVVAYERALRPVIFRYPPATISEYYDLYIALNPVVAHIFVSIALLLIQTLLFLISSKRLDWNSRLSACLPMVLSAIYALHAPLSHDRRADGLPDARLCLLGLLTVLWTSTFFASPRTAGCHYNGDEYYCLSALRHRAGSLSFFVISIFLIWTRTVTYCLLMIPLYFAWQVRSRSLQNFELVLASLFAACVLVRHTISRQRSMANSACLSSKHASSGIFAWLRQPELLAEIATWWVFYAFAWNQTRFWIHWSMIGPVSQTGLSIIWQALAEFDIITPDPSYSEYKRNVWMLFPIPPHLSRRRPALVVKKQQ